MRCSGIVDEIVFPDGVVIHEDVESVPVVLTVPVRVEPVSVMLVSIIVPDSVRDPVCVEPLSVKAPVFVMVPASIRDPESEMLHEEVSFDWIPDQVEDDGIVIPLLVIIPESDTVPVSVVTAQESVRISEAILRVSERAEMEPERVVPESDTVPVLLKVPVSVRAPVSLKVPVFEILPVSVKPVLIVPDSVRTSVEPVLGTVPDSVIGSGTMLTA